MLSLTVAATAVSLAQYQPTNCSLVSEAVECNGDEHCLWLEDEEACVRKPRPGHHHGRHGHHGRRGRHGHPGYHFRVCLNATQADCGTHEQCEWSETHERCLPSGPRPMMPDCRAASEDDCAQLEGCFWWAEAQLCRAGPEPDQAAQEGWNSMRPEDVAGQQGAMDHFLRQHNDHRRRHHHHGEGEEDRKYFIPFVVAAALAAILAVVVVVLVCRSRKAAAAARSSSAPAGSRPSEPDMMTSVKEVYEGEKNI